MRTCGLCKAYFFIRPSEQAASDPHPFRISDFAVGHANFGYASCSKFATALSAFCFQ